MMNGSVEGRHALLGIEGVCPFCGVDFVMENMNVKRSYPEGIEVFSVCCIACSERESSPEELIGILRRYFENRVGMGMFHL